MQQFGIDFIGLTTTDFRVNSLDKFNISRTTIPDEEIPLLTIDQNNVKHFAQKAYLQTDSAIIDINRTGLRVNFNPSKFLHPYELNTDLTDITEIIKTEVAEAGIDTDITDSKIWRLDLTKQANMSQPVHVYNGAFGYLRGKRLVSKNYPSGYSFSNKSNEVVFYDKRAELACKFKLNIPESNFMRAEVKYLKTKNVITHTGCKSYMALLGTDVGQLRDSYNNYLTKKIFTKDKLGDQLALNFESEAEILKSYLELNYRNGIMKYITDLGLDTMLELFGSLEGFERLLQAVNVERTKVYRTIKKLEQHIQLKGRLDKKRGMATIASRLYEVEQTFVG